MACRKRRVAGPEPGQTTPLSDSGLSTKIRLGMAQDAPPRRNAMIETVVAAPLALDIHWDGEKIRELTDRKRVG